MIAKISSRGTHVRSKANVLMVAYTLTPRFELVQSKEVFLSIPSNVLALHNSSIAAPSNAIYTSDERALYRINGGAGFADGTSRVAFPNVRRAKESNVTVSVDVLRTPRLPTDKERRVHGKRVTANESVEASLESGNKSLKEMITEFVTGMKLLWSDIRLAWQTAAQRRAGHALTFQEQRFLRQVRQVGRPHHVENFGVLPITVPLQY